MLLNLALFDAGTQALDVARLSEMGASEALVQYFATHGSTPCARSSGQAWFELLQARPHVDYLCSGHGHGAYEVAPSKSNFLRLLSQLLDAPLRSWKDVAGVLSTRHLVVAIDERTGEGGDDEGVLLVTTRCRRTGRVQSATLDVRLRRHTYVRLHGTQRAFATASELHALARALPFCPLTAALLCLLTSAETAERPVPARIVADAAGSGSAVRLALLCAQLSTALRTWLSGVRAELSDAELVEALLVSTVPD